MVGVTSLTRVTTAAGKCMPESILCHTQLTSSLLLQHRALKMRMVERTQTYKASLRGSASSDPRETEDLKLKLEKMKKLGRRSVVDLESDKTEGWKDYCGSNSVQLLRISVQQLLLHATTLLQQ